MTQQPIRVGGHVLRESGWEIENGLPPAPDTEPDADEHDEPSIPDTDDPDHGECPECREVVRLKKDGTPRKHDCEPTGDPADQDEDEPWHT